MSLILIFEVLLTAQLMVSLIIYMSSSPLFMSLLIILISAIQGLFSFILLSKWMGLGVILIFIGGMMVVFLYVSSLSSNNKFIIHTNLSTIALIAFLSIWTCNQTKLIYPISASIVPINLYSTNWLPSMIFLISYLLMTLFIATKISESFKGSLIEKF